VALDGLLADDEDLADLAARVPLGDELDHLGLARGERVGRRGGVRALEVRADERADSR